MLSSTRSVLLVIAVAGLLVCAGYLADSVQDIFFDDTFAPGEKPPAEASLREHQHWLDFKALYDRIRPGEYSCLVMSALVVLLAGLSFGLFLPALQRKQVSMRQLSNTHALQLVVLSLLVLLIAAPEGAYRGLLNTNHKLLLLQLFWPAFCITLAIALSSIRRLRSIHLASMLYLSLAQLAACAWYSSQLFYATIGWTSSVIR